MEEEVHQWLKDKIEPVLFNPIKQERRDGISRVEEELLSYIKEKYGEEKYTELATLTREIFEEVVRNTPRGQVTKENRRVDGRALDEIRPISIEFGSPSTCSRGSPCLRGETQALHNDLSTSQDEQRLMNSQATHLADFSFTIIFRHGQWAK